jgi:hypothetical protein
MASRTCDTRLQMRRTRIAFFNRSSVFCATCAAARGGWSGAGQKDSRCEYFNNSARLVMPGERVSFHTT